MKYELTEHPLSTKTGCLVIGIFKDSNPSEFQALIPEEHTELFARLFNQITEERPQLWQAIFGNISLMLVYCGERSSFKSEKYLKTLSEIASQLIQHKVTDTVIALPPIADNNLHWQLENTILKLQHIFYQLLDFKQDKKKKYLLEKVTIYLPGANPEALTEGLAIADAIAKTKTLANLPANVCTPTFLAQEAEALAQQYSSIDTTILNEDDLKTLGMGAFLAVAKGSHEPPKLIEIHYHGAPNTQPIVLVGKGITFDSGGISLKPPTGMEEMKYDMAGAASVLGVLQACAALKLPINVIGLMACAENMPGGGATKPGDIITTLSGLTVEIVNTDAEGRLVLADTLTYAEQFNPRFVLDVATLTGAIIIALGRDNSGFMTEDESLANLIHQAAQQSLDHAWRLPLQTCYHEALESPLADMVNATLDKSAGSVTAACFLSRFTTKYPWAHFDIAGTAWISGKKNQATGRPVGLLVEILRNAAKTS